MKTKTINVADLFSHAEKYAISKIISERVFAEYGDLHEFKWQISVTGHFEIPVNYEEVES
jgi:hypothetical protein